MLCVAETFGCVCVGGGRRTALDVVTLKCYHFKAKQTDTEQYTHDCKLISWMNSFFSSMAVAALISLTATARPRYSAAQARHITYWYNT